MDSYADIKYEREKRVGNNQALILQTLVMLILENKIARLDLLIARGLDPIESGESLKGELDLLDHLKNIRLDGFNYSETKEDIANQITRYAIKAVNALKGPDSESEDPSS